MQTKFYPHLKMEGFKKFANLRILNDNHKFFIVKKR